MKKMCESGNWCIINRNWFSYLRYDVGKTQLICMIFCNLKKQGIYFLSYFYKDTLNYWRNNTYYFRNSTFNLRHLSIHLWSTNYNLIDWGLVCECLVKVHWSCFFNQASFNRRFEIFFLIRDRGTESGWFIKKILINKDKHILWVRSNTCLIFIKIVMVNKFNLNFI